MERNDVTGPGSDLLGLKTPGLPTHWGGFPKALRSQDTLSLPAFDTWRAVETTTGAPVPWLED